MYRLSTMSSEKTQQDCSPTILPPPPPPPQLRQPRAVSSDENTCRWPFM